MSPRAHAVDPVCLAQWCTEHLGSPPADEIFRSGYLSAVIGLRLADDREVVVKVRPDSPRIAACVEVQRRMFQAGYPCPRPLTGAAPFGDDAATAEAHVPGGAVLPSADHAARAFAEAFAWLIRLAPRPAEVSTLDPAPSWAAWNHAGDGLWPCPEDPDVNLNEVAGPEWINDAGRYARDRLRASESEAVIGHCDWLADNLRWSGDTLLVVHDWDSVTADSEAVLVGFAAALYSTVSAGELATVEETERFLLAYCHARGREFSADELERSWAAGVWTRAYDAKYQHAVGQPITSLSENEARERLRRTGTGSPARPARHATAGEIVSNALPGQGLWDAFVEARRQLHRRQAEFYQQASDRQAVLRAALDHGADAWQQGTAFDFLQAFPGDVMPLLPEVFRWAVKSERWAAPAREAIARLPRDERMTLLEPLFLDQLEVAEDDDYPNLAGLAARCEAWRLLERLVQQAANNDNPEVRELAEYYNDTYGPMWQPKQ